ncbi:MAG: putative integrase [Prokaryotic dsDNA virus sp.]|nr:MAG: putative integrase [Prokaryotic dsDNA virus sp.]|tara:strand:- start:33300 stop:34502 length:1203 start_codon:yes stop_codon:yes gene_type:complete
MSITQRGSSYEAAVNYKGSRYRRSFKDRLQAEIWEAQAKADLVAGRVPEVSAQASNRGLPRTLDDLRDYTYRTVWAGSKSEDTALLNSGAVVKAIGPRTMIEDIDKVSIDLAVAEWKRLGNSNGTINRKLSALSKMLTVAEELGVIDRKPSIKKSKENQGRIRWYTDEEQLRIMRMFNHLGYPEYGGIVRVLLDTGMRCGELFSLEWEDIQDNLIVLSDTKNSSPRSIPMTEEVSRIINSHQAEVFYVSVRTVNSNCQNLDHDNEDTITEANWHRRVTECGWYVRGGPQRGLPVGPFNSEADAIAGCPWILSGPFKWTNYDRTRRLFDRVREQLGWSDDPQATLHACRHTFISNLVQEGVPIAMVQRLAGHKTIQMTMRYTHLAPKDLESAIEKLQARRT